MANCPHNNAPNKNVFGTAEGFEAAQRARRRRLVAEYMATVEDAGLRARLLRLCERELADLGIELGH